MRFVRTRVEAGRRRLLAPEGLPGHLGERCRLPEAREGAARPVEKGRRRSLREGEDPRINRLDEQTVQGRRRETRPDSRGNFSIKSTTRVVESTAL